jgi:hypothetical protein
MLKTIFRRMMIYLPEFLKDMVWRNAYAVYNKSRSKKEIAVLLDRQTDRQTASVGRRKEYSAIYKRHPAYKAAIYPIFISA